MAVPSQLELDFMASFARFEITPKKENDVEPKIIQEPEPFHKQFHLFPLLLPEIRAKIWSLTFPPRPRIILIKPIPKTGAYNEVVDYVASPISYGGKHPVALSVCRESRGEFLRKYEERFHAYWDLKEDVPYVEVKTNGAVWALEQVGDMRKRGLWKGFRKVALDIDVWMANKLDREEHPIDLLRTQHEITDYYFICRHRRNHKDILDPGVSWYLVDGQSLEQTEFRTHKDWCRVIMRDQKTMTEDLNRDLEVNGKEWEGRGFQPVIRMMIIEGRKMEERLPRISIDHHGHALPFDRFGD